MNKKIQLFCMPYAGGSKDAFAALSTRLAHFDVEVCTMEYAGHGERRKEAFYPTFNDMVRDAAAFIQEHRKPECAFALLGYSMGSVVVYELLAQGLLTDSPKHVFLASHEAPDVEWPGKAYCDLEDAEFLKVLQSMGGFQKLDDKLLANRFFRMLYFEPIREDYRLLAQYQMSARIVLPCAATVFYAREDIPPERIRLWTPFLTKDSEFVALGDNHFLIRQCLGELVEIMKGKL